MTVAVVFRHIRERDGLNRKLRKTETALDKLRKEIAEKRGRIKQLSEEVEMLQPIYEQLHSYYDMLTKLQLEEERRAVEEEDKKKAEQESEKRRRRLGP